MTIIEAKTRLHQWDEQPWFSPATSSWLRLGAVAASGVLVAGLVRHRSLPGRALRLATNPALLTAVVPFVIKTLSKK